MKRLYWILSVVLTVSGCASTSIEGKTYRDISPSFSIDQFFDGQIKAWGIVQDRSGNLVQHFEVLIDGTFENDVLTLDETFTYGLGDGVKSRIWTIEKTPDGNLLGQAGDILGKAQGTSFGNAFNWRYQIDLPVGDSSYKVKFDDWIWAFDENTIMNRSYVKKFGITFADVTIFMQKQSD